MHLKKSLTIVFLLITYFLTAQNDPYFDYNKMAAAKSFQNRNLFSQSSPLLGQYDVSFYYLNLNVENNSNAISGYTNIKYSVYNQSLDTFAFELSNYINIDSIIINNNSFDYFRDGDLVLVPAQATNNLLMNSAFIYYKRPHIEDDTDRGIITAFSEDWNQHASYTLSEPFSSKDWFAVKQDLTDKADSVYVFVTTSDTNKVGSQGMLTDVVQLPDNKVRYEWKSRLITDYYLISIAVANYQEYNFSVNVPHETGDSIFIQNYLYNSDGCLEYYKSKIDRTGEIMQLFSDLFGAYPFASEKYGHCLSEIGGGMEHQTMTTMGDFNFILIGHELAHSWFGNSITCENWNDIWINEGFATYSDYLAHEYLATQWAGVWLKNVESNIVSEPDGSVYVPQIEVENENVSRIFNGRLSYAKGAFLLHMIRYIMDDDDLFFNILKTYHSRFKNSVATASDFKEILEELSNIDFTNFFNQWYYGEGYPVFDISWQQNQTNVNLEINQTTSSTITEYFEIPLDIQFFLDNGADTIIKFYPNSFNANQTIDLNTTVDSILVDPNNWIINKVGEINNIIITVDPTNDISIYPNPTSSVLEIYFSDNTIPHENSYQLFTLDGKKVFEQKESGSLVKFSMKDLKIGIYLLKIEGPEINSVFKIIKD